MILSFQKRFKKPIKAGTKIHSLREDFGGRWRKGRDIQMVTDRRTPKQKQFHKAICTAVQLVEVEWRPELFLNLVVRIGGRTLSTAETTVFVKNDGFTDIQDFFGFFKGSFHKKNGIIKKRLIHWTEYRY